MRKSSQTLEAEIWIDEESKPVKVVNYSNLVSEWERYNYDFDAVLKHLTLRRTSSTSKNKTKGYSLGVYVATRNWLRVVRVGRIQL